MKRLFGTFDINMKNKLKSERKKSERRKKGEKRHIVLGC